MLDLRLLALVLAALVVVAPAPRAYGRHSTEAEVERLSNEAVTAYRAGDYARAVELLRAAYKLHADPVLLYNLGKAEEMRGNRAEARAHYRAFIAAPSADPKLKAKAQARLVALESATTPPATATAPPAPPPATLTPPPPATSPSVAPPPPARHFSLTPRREWIGGAIVAGVGVAGIAVGAGLYAHVVSLHDQFAADPLEADRQSLKSRAQTEAAASTAMYVVGGLLAAAGAGLITHGLLRERPRRTAFLPLAGPHEVGVCVEQSF